MSYLIMQKVYLEDLKQLNKEIDTIEKVFKNLKYSKSTRSLAKETLLQLYKERDYAKLKAKYYGAVHQRTQTDKPNLKWR